MGELAIVLHEADELMGVSVFIISWVSTLMSFTQLSVSLLASSPRMSLNPIMRTCLPRSMVCVSRTENADSCFSTWLI